MTRGYGWHASWWAAALAIAVLGSGCGGVNHAARAQRSPVLNTSAARAPVATKPTRKPPADSDNDGDNGDDDVHWGHEASKTDLLAVRALLKRYYAAGLAEDGARACPLLYSLFEEEIPELYGEGSGAPYLQGSTCPQVMTKLFIHERRTLVAHAPKLRVVMLRVKRLRGLAILSFGGAPDREIIVHRERRAWKVAVLEDHALG
jgi:hypothetical protein